MCFQDKELQDQVGSVCGFRISNIFILFELTIHGVLLSSGSGQRASLAANMPVKSPDSLKRELGKLGGRTIRGSSREIMFAQLRSREEKPKEEKDVQRRTVK